MASQIRKHGGVRMRLRNPDSENSKLRPPPQVCNLNLECPSGSSELVFAKPLGSQG
ncbi:hypothetical protein GALL_30370 [mine drainage metagenome]|uniref:Uncharacterized protein n=1 Tax=mine drainage metagenome TaxID=410659 RepID=A0A1J5TRI4_9ZZZZ